MGISLAYESFGDYIGETVPQLMEKTDAVMITLTGETFTKQLLYGKIQKTLGAKYPLMNKNFPIGRENTVYGALYV